VQAQQYVMEAGNWLWWLRVFDHFLLSFVLRSLALPQTFAY
jgi:hypothetical protein